MSPTPISPELRTAAEKVTAVLSEAVVLAARAAKALDAGDADEVLLLIEERSDLLRSSEASLTLIRSAVADPAHAHSEEIAALLETVVASARQLDPSQARLAMALESERDRIGRELDQVESDEAVRSAYGKQTRERATINIVR